MVNITQCAACGRVIPATEDGCAYCDREGRERPYRPYLSLAVKLLLALFLLDAVIVAIWAGLALAQRDAGAAIGTTSVALRLVAALAALGGFLSGRSWGWYACVVFGSLEVVLGLGNSFGIDALRSWGIPFLTPLWTLLFVGMLMRDDVRALFDSGVADRHEVAELLRSVEKGDLD